MKAVTIILASIFLFSCTKKYSKQCHSVAEFYDTNPIDVKKVFTAAFKEVGCNVYQIDITHYNKSEETIYMDFYHQRIIKK